MGSYIELEKAADPDFAFPGRKPVGPVELEKSVRGTVINFARGGYAEQYPSKKPDIQLLGTPTISGDYLRCENSDEAIKFTGSEFKLEGYNELTIAFVARINSFVDPWGGIVVYPRAGGTENQFVITKSSTFTSVEVRINDGAKSNISGITTTSLADGVEHKHVITRSGTTFEWWIDGLLKGTATLTTSDNFSTGDSIVHFSAERTFNAANVSNIDWSLFIQERGRVWSYSEIIQWCKTPYQILKPAIPLSVFISSGGAGSPPTLQLSAFAA